MSFKTYLKNRAILAVGFIGGILIIAFSISLPDPLSVIGIIIGLVVIAATAMFRDYLVQYD